MKRFLLFVVVALLVLPLAWRSSAYWILRGDDCSRHNSWEEALRDYEQARQLAPGDWRPLAREAMVYGKLGRPKDEEAAYRQALSFSERSETLLPWAQICMAQGRFDQARLLLRRAIANNFAPMESRFMLGQIALSQQNRGEARKWWSQVLEINPYCSYALGGMGFLAQQDENWAQAADYFERAACATPEVNQEVLLNAATSYLKLGRQSDALRCLHRANSFSPGAQWAPAMLLEAGLWKKGTPEYQLIVAQLNQMRLTPEQRVELSSLKS